jgi:serine/threonine-protein kinase
MAPEQLAGEQHVDARSDVYALAVVGYEMLTGASPFSGATPQAVAAAHFTVVPRALTTLRPDAPRALGDVIGRALQQEPSARFATAAEFRDALAPHHAAGAGRRRPVATAIAIGSVATVMVAGLLLWQSHRGAAVHPNPRLIAVEPFTVLDPSLALWREGMVDVLSHNLDGAGPLRAVTPALVIHAARDSGATPVDLARGLGAGLAVAGRLEASGHDSVRVTVTLLDVTTGQPRDEIAARGSMDHMDWVSDSVTIGLLRAISRTQPVGAARGSLAGAKSLPALKALLESEQAFRRGAWDSAQAAADRAIELDSTFALGYYWAGFARGWSHTAGESLSVVYAQRAQALNHGLSPRDSFLIASNAVMDGGSLSSGCATPTLFAAAQGSVERYPDDPQVWNNLGEIRVHCGFGGRVGVTARLALNAFDRAIALDSDFAPAYAHATELALAAGGSAEGVRYARRYLRFNPPTRDAEANQLVIALLTNPRDTAASRRLADSCSTEGVVRAAILLSPVADSAESSVWLGLQLVRRLGPMTPVFGGSTAPAAAFWVDALMHRGHLRAVRSLFGRLPQGGPRIGPVTALASFADLDIMSQTAMDSMLALTDNVSHGWSWFGLRWWAARRDTANLRRFLSLRTARVGNKPEARELNAAAYDTAITRVYVSLARGDTADAMRRLAVLPDSLCQGACGLDAITYATLLTEHGRAATAESLLNRRYEYHYLTAPAVLQNLALARAAARAGDDQTAADQYERVVAAWANGDPEVQPAVAEARAALLRLSKER